MPSSGLSSQFMLALETTWSVPVTPTVALPLVSETMEQTRDRIEAASIIANRRVMTSEQWNGGNISAGGDVQLELYKRNLGKIFKLMFGTVGTTGAGPYTHTFSPGDLTGVSATTQIGMPSTAGVVTPKSYTGSKVASWQLACAVGEVATLGVTFLAKREIRSRTVSDGVTTISSPNITSATAAFTADDVLTPISGAGIPANTYIATVTSATAATLGSILGTPVNATASGTSIAFTIGIPLATATYTTGLGMPFKFTHGSVTIGGAAVSVTGATLNGDNGLDDARRFLGQPTISEPIEKQLRVYDGTLEVEFTDLTQYNRFVAASEVALVLSFVSGTDSLTITENVRFDGETPKVAGPDILTQTIPFKAIASGADSTAISAVLVNGDVTP